MNQETGHLVCKTYWKAPRTLLPGSSAFRSEKNPGSQKAAASLHAGKKPALLLHAVGTERHAQEKTDQHMKASDPPALPAPAGRSTEAETVSQRVAALAGRAGHDNKRKRCELLILLS